MFDDLSDFDPWYNYDDGDQPEINDADIVSVEDGLAARMSSIAQGLGISTDQATRDFNSCRYRI